LIAPSSKNARRLLSVPPRARISRSEGIYIPARPRPTNKTNKQTLAAPRRALAVVWLFVFALVGRNQVVLIDVRIVSCRVVSCRVASPPPPALLSSACFIGGFFPSRRRRNFAPSKPSVFFLW
jgi:hypothetical protein